jgi:hypothetical protein
MKMYRLTKSFLTASTLLLLAGQFTHAQHLNAGATGHNQNDQLLWANGAAFATNSGYVQNMTLATSGRYAGFFNTGAPTLTSLRATNGGPAFGSFIMAEIVSLDGPAGSSLSFWEGVDQGGGPTPLFTITAGTSGASLQYALSDVLGGAGQPGGDPFGHLHGRRFTVTEEGLYTVGLRAIDTSVNGLGGGAIHTPSDILYLNFQTVVPEPSTYAMAGLGLAGWWLFRRKRRA